MPLQQPFKAQPEHPQEQELFPFFLDFTGHITIAVNIATMIAVTIIVGAFIQYPPKVSYG